MSTQSQPIRREDVVLALTYAAATWLLHGLDITAFGEPFVAPLAPWWPLFTLVGCASVILRRSRPALMVPACTVAALALCLTGSVGGFFLLFEAVFSLVLFGSARAARTAEVTVLAVCAAAGVAGWASTSSLSAGVVVVLTAGMVLLLPAEWAANLRKARELAESETARAAAIRQAAHDQAQLAARDHELALAAERQEMARELHDVLSARLSAIALQSGAALTVGDNRLDREVLGHVRRESVQGLEELAGMIRMLNSGTPRPRVGTVADLDAVVEGHRAAGLDIAWSNRLPDDGADLPGPVQAALYRIATESLVNAGRHAPGAAIRMELDRRGPGVRLRVTDDGGPGAGPSAAATDAGPGRAGGGPRVPPAWPGPGTGTGVPSMLARAEQLGGRASAGPRGGGWCVDAWLPSAAAAGLTESSAPTGPTGSTSPAASARLTGPAAPAASPAPLGLSGPAVSHEENADEPRSACEEHAIPAQNTAPAGIGAAKIRPAGSITGSTARSRANSAAGPAAEGDGS